MAYIHKIRVNRKTGEVIDYQVTPSEIKINHNPLVNYILNRMIEGGILKDEQNERDNQPSNDHSN